MAFNAKELIGRHYGRLKNAGTAMKPALATAGSKLGAGVARTGTGVANVAGAATGWAGAKANAVGSAVSGAAFAGGAMAAKGIFSWLAGAIIPRTKREKFITFACLLWALDFFTDFNTSIIYVLLTGLVMSYYAITNLYGLSSGLYSSEPFGSIGLRDFY